MMLASSLFLALSLSKGLALSLSKGLALSLSKGLALSLSKGLALSLSKGLPLGAVEFNWGYTLGHVAGSLLITVLTWIVAARVSLARQDKNIEAMREAQARQFSLIETLATKMDEIKDEQAALREDRMGCEIRAGKTFAGRDELAALSVDMAVAQRDTADKVGQIGASFRSSVGKAHSRIDDNLQRLTRLEERVGKVA